MKPTAAIRTSPADFLVEEIPAYPPSGQGEHLFVRVRKTGLTTLDCVRRLASALEADPRGVGYAGMKDRHAVTTQTFSVPFGMNRAVQDAWRAEGEGLEVIEAARNSSKLRTGHLAGNRFRIVLRSIAPDEILGVRSALERAASEGFPNAFGPQRFGRHGSNPERALAWLRGRGPAPGNPRERRMLFSSVQSMLFDEVLRLRVQDGTWSVALQGDLLKKHATGGLFICADAQVDDERARMGEVSPTGPIFGAKMRWPEGRPAELERQVLADGLGDPALLDRHSRYGEGTRRPLRSIPTELQFDTLPGVNDAIAVQFVLSKGAYATTFLSVGCDLLDLTKTIFDNRETSRHDELLEDTVLNSD